MKIRTQVSVDAEQSKPIGWIQNFETTDVELMFIIFGSDSASEVRFRYLDKSKWEAALSFFGVTEINDLRERPDF